jgi:hypothetical protein
VELVADQVLVLVAQDQELVAQVPVVVDQEAVLAVLELVAVDQEVVQLEPELVQDLVAALAQEPEVVLELQLLQDRNLFGIILPVSRNSGRIISFFTFLIFCSFIG